MSFRFQFRRGTTAERDASNPILAAGEPAVVLDSGQPAELVLGDGVTAMADLRAAVWDDDARLAAAATATQPGDLGTAAAANVADLATAAQGAKADTAVQPATLAAGYAAQGTDATQRLMALLATEGRDASMLVVGDSTGNETGEWVYKLAQSLAAPFPRWTVNYRLWDDTGQVFSAATVIQTGASGKTLTIYNASISGASCTGWQAPRFNTAIAPLTPDLVIVSLGHNEQILAADLWHSRYVGLVEQIASRLTQAPVLLIAQNPATGNTNQQQRREVYREIANLRGYGFIDVCKAFEDAGGDLTSDTIHPTPAGQQLWHDTVLPAFTYQRGVAPRTQPPSPLLLRGDNLLLNPQLTLTAGVPTSWAMSGAAAAVDAVNFESSTYDRTTGGTVVSTAVKFTGASSGQAILRQYLPIKRVAGRWVTFAVRIYVPTGQAITVGRVVLTGSGTTISSSESASFGGWRWAVVSRYIPAGATSAEAFVYIDSAATATGNCTIDRVCAVVGKFPMEA